MREFALCSVVNDRFVPGYIAMIDTFRRANPGLKPALYVIAGQDQTFLSPTARALILETCGDVTFIEADPDDYAEVYELAHSRLNTPPKLLPAFYLFEAFRATKERFVLCLDSDMLILGSFEEVLSCPARFAAVRARNAFTGYAETYVNTGVLWLDTARLKAFSRPQYLLEMVGDREPERGSGLADQAVINMIWSPQTMFYLPEIFNFTKRSLMFEMIDRNPEAGEAFAAGLQHGNSEDYLAVARTLDLRTLHYVGQKPWDVKTTAREQVFAPMEDLWWQALDRQGNQDAMDWAIQLAGA